MLINDGAEFPGWYFAAAIGLHFKLELRTTPLAWPSPYTETRGIKRNRKNVGWSPLWVSEG